MEDTSHGHDKDVCRTIVLHDAYEIQEYLALKKKLDLMKKNQTQAAINAIHKKSTSRRNAANSAVSERKVVTTSLKDIRKSIFVKPVHDKSFNSNPLLCSSNYPFSSTHRTLIEPLPLTGSPSELHPIQQHDFLPYPEFLPPEKHKFLPTLKEFRLRRKNVEFKPQLKIVDFKPYHKIVKCKPNKFVEFKPQRKTGESEHPSKIVEFNSPCELLMDDYPSEKIESGDHAILLNRDWHSISPALTVSFYPYRKAIINPVTGRSIFFPVGVSSGDTSDETVTSGHGIITRSNTGNIIKLIVQRQTFQNNLCASQNEMRKRYGSIQNKSLTKTRKALFWILMTVL